MSSNEQPNQNGDTSSNQDDWKHRPPYQIHTSSESFPTIWTGKCHCGRVQYQLSRRSPLASKYCHCQTCQRLHGSPFQWAAIFHKTDINFTHGHHDLSWYDPGECTTRHKLPCKVSCHYCRTPIMDEGRNMILLFPTLIEGINTPAAREAFKVQCHMFYARRVLEVRDGVEKWEGMNEKSRRMDDEGNIVGDGGEEGENAGEGGGEEGEKTEASREEPGVKRHENKRQKIEGGS